MVSRSRTVAAARARPDRRDMIGGVGMVACPPQYGVSGVMTFIVNHDGVVYQKDLGPETAQAAAAITPFNPDSTWQRVPSGVPVARAP
jgi:DUF2950 family protein